MLYALLKAPNDNLILDLPYNNSKTNPCHMRSTAVWGNVSIEPAVPVPK